MSANIAEEKRRYDVVVWGATGFTGRLVARYLLRNYGIGNNIRWAIAGRDQQKLESLRDSLCVDDAAAVHLPILVADIEDGSSLDRLTQVSRVVAATAGPFAKVGTQLVEACVRNRTHYCDITGEVQWVRRMIEEHHEQAKRNRTCIVHCCGFDSIPSDLGAYMMCEYLRTQHDAHCNSIHAYVGGRFAGMSGGTLASVINAVEEVAKDPSARKVFSSVLGLVPEAERKPGGERWNKAWARRDPSLKVWTGPFMMAAINTRVVYRSDALLGHSYGPNFNYHERLITGRGAKGWIRANSIALGTNAGTVASALPMSRWFLKHFVLPKPGQGPSELARREANFHLSFEAEADSISGKPPLRLRGSVSADGDPGYDETAKMLSESALCLSQGPSSLNLSGGVLTPASCMGRALTTRLKKAGMRFEVSEI